MGLGGGAGIVPSAVSTEVPAEWANFDMWAEKTAETGKPTAAASSKNAAKREIDLWTEIIDSSIATRDGF